MRVGSLLEDEMQPNGLVADCAAVKKACNRLDKRRQWLQDIDSETVQPQLRKRKFPPRASQASRPMIST
jgi:hypothetical protein